MYYVTTWFGRWVLFQRNMQLPLQGADEDLGSMFWKTDNHIQSWSYMNNKKSHFCRTVGRMVICITDRVSKCNRGIILWRFLVDGSTVIWPLFPWYIWSIKRTSKRPDKRVRCACVVEEYIPFFAVSLLTCYILKFVCLLQTDKEYVYSVIFIVCFRFSE